MMKFQFNSYQLNGATITTILIFLAQIACLTVYKSSIITFKWILGAIMILAGTILLKEIDQEKSETTCKHAKNI